jgi:hypothetical protein
MEAWQATQEPALPLQDPRGEEGVVHVVSEVGRVRHQDAVE